MAQITVAMMIAQKITTFHVAPIQNLGFKMFIIAIVNLILMQTVDLISAK